MAHKFRLDFDGQSVVQDDYNGLAEEASTGEDHVYAELFRLTPGVGSIARGVIPYGTSATIVANGASGSVLVNPFRVVIGSRTAAATDAVENWQDVRSSLSIADGATALTTQITHAANATGNPRWDAIYAAVTIDSASTPTTRKVKNPGTAVVTDESVSVYSRTAVTVSVVAGTAAATPVFPTVPADAGSVYYVLLGYIRIPDGFAVGSTVLPADINESCSILSISPTTGASLLRPANHSNIDAGDGITGAGTTTNVGTMGTLKWTGTAGSRPTMYLPPSMIGSESILVAIDVGNASSANWSHQSGDVIDSSRDWRNRVCSWKAIVGKDGVSFGLVPWSRTTANSLMTTSDDTPTQSAPLAGYNQETVCSTNVSGIGSTFLNSNKVNGSEYAFAISAAGVAADTPSDGNNISTNVMTSTTFVGVYADTSTGELKLYVAGAPGVVMFLWLEFTAQYPNF